MRHRQIGIFGGTFDPVHLGHLLVAGDAYEALSLDRVLFVPAANPPHKPSGPVVDAGRRLAMVRAAIDGDGRFSVDDLEVRRGGTSYTVDTLRELQSREPDAELVFLLGIDQFRELDSWRDPREVVRLARLAVLARSGETHDLTGPYEGVAVPVRRIDISGTEIRARIATGRSIRYLVPEPVLRIIEAERLYAVGKGGA